MRAAVVFGFRPIEAQWIAGVNGNRVSLDFQCQWKSSDTQFLKTVEFDCNSILTTSYIQVPHVFDRHWTAIVISARAAPNT
jgi:hypothetical protein